MKTPMSRFQIHDDLTAPEGSVPVLRGALATGGQLPNFLGALAGSPAALRGYARFRSELRRGALDVTMLERISLAIAEHHGSQPGIAMHNRTARQAGLPLDEIAAARRFNSSDEKVAALLRYLKAVVENPGRAADAPARGGARGRLVGRADPRGDRVRRARALHGDGERRRRRPGRRIGRGHADAPAA